MAKKRGGSVTADLIVQEAATLFRKKGYYATSLSQIARAVGVDKSALYYHFSGKHAILERILRLNSEMFMPSVEAVVMSPTPASERLRQLIRLQILLVSNDPYFSSVGLSVHHLREQGVPMDVIDLHQNILNRYRNIMAGLIREGIEQGTFQEADAGLATLAILGMLNWMVNWYRPDGPLTASELADRFADMILNGLLRNRLPLDTPTSPC